MKLHRRSALFWLLAFVLVAAAAFWQRWSGPSHPLRGTVELADGASLRYRLLRNATTDADAVVVLPDVPGLQRPQLHFRRHGLPGTFTAVQMHRDARGWTGRLPRQPAAGKLDYYLSIEDGPRIPADPAQVAVIRFRNPVPPLILLPHILMMFTAMLCGVRAGLAAFAEPARVRRLTRVTLACLTLGGLVLGPVVQKLAFGAYWTGWPAGEDLTDTKTLLMWAGWLGALLIIERQEPLTHRGRLAIVFAVVLMIAVYLVPHSLRGSTLDYRKLDEGIPAEEAIRTG